MLTLNKRLALPYDQYQPLPPLPFDIFSLIGLVGQKMHKNVNASTIFANQAHTLANFFANCAAKSVLNLTISHICMLCNQAQKELLDAELDFHKKMSSGEDTTDLKRKLGQLQVEVIHMHTLRMTKDQLSGKNDNSAPQIDL